MGEMSRNFMKQQNAAHMYVVWLSMASKITKSLSRESGTDGPGPPAETKDHLPRRRLSSAFGFHPILKGDEDERVGARARRQPRKGVEYQRQFSAKTVVFQEARSNGK